MLEERLMLSFFKRIVLAIFMLAIFTAANADVDFVASKIRINGLQRISEDTVRSYLPIKEGDRVNAAKTADTIRILYKTGFFTSVDLEQQGNTLIVKVSERPTIGELNISGNKEISRKQLMDALKSAGFIEGRPFDDAVLNGLKQALTQQYYSFGYYNIDVSTKVSDLGRGRVKVDIKVDEGAVAKVKSIKFIGNRAFSSSALLKNFSLTTGSILDFITHSSQYSKEKLDADLESLRTFYLDHGYLQFKVLSTDAKMSADKKSVYITVTVSEGSIYRISGWSIEGNLLGKDAEVRNLITLNKGDVFSRKVLVDTNTAIGKFFGNYGYANPQIQSEPEVNDTTKRIFIHFMISPGKRVYVRRINFSGNTKTHETVLRREMRQQEGAMYSLKNIDESKRRLNNLGYVKGVDVKVEPVPEYPDQVDLSYNLQEAASVAANLQVGYSDTDGILYGANLNDQNFMGSGKNVGIQFSRSKYSTSYGINYYDPYFTKDNMSLAVEAYNQRTSPNSIRLTSYNTNAYGLSAIFGIPISDYSRVSFGYGFENIALSTMSNTATQVTTFLDKYGKTFSVIKVLGGWSYSKLDKIIFPTEGFANNFNVELGVPVGKNRLQYYKGTYDLIWYQPLSKYFITRFSTTLGYGNGYGSMKSLPFFKNYYCGGIGSVRGFEGSSLGPLDSQGNPFGGNILTDASLALIFPNFFGETVRTSAFVDAGNVYLYENEYAKSFALKNIRSSVGIQAEWQSPLGMVLTLSIAKPINKKTGDRLDAFQFNMGASI